MELISIYIFKKSSKINAFSIENMVIFDEYFNGTYIWYPDEVACMELMGNMRANELYINDKSVEKSEKPNADANFYQREKYIRDKYEYLKSINMNMPKKIEKPVEKTKV